MAASVIGEFTEVEYIGKTADSLVLQAKLAAGQDMMVTLEPPPAFVPTGKAGAQYIPHYTRSAGPGTGHTVVLAGYAHFAHGTYFLMHNSWGTELGRRGIRLDPRVDHATMVAGDRRGGRRAAPPRAGEPPAPPARADRMRADLVPDSIRAICTPPCPDHSPATTASAPSLASAPPASSTSPGPACSPRRPPAAPIRTPARPGRAALAGAATCCAAASDSACTGASCQASCPAPDFILAKMGDELVCEE